VLQGQASRIRRVILLGTCHTAGVIGAVASGADAFETPIGLVPVDRDATTEALRVTGVYQDDEAHRIDHALEVELPFLQRTLGRFSIVPLLVGRQAVEAVTGVLDLLVDQESLIVVSTDLSHYQNYEAAQALDRSTAAAIEKLAPENLDPSQACGFDALRGLLEFARNQHWRARVLDLRSSGDTAGPRDRVVGYVAAVLYESNGSA
jgi:AmmeMemoRadiSam system protein B